ncbi:unnamed protein product [Microthlaspi erraticum]|uniref:At3g05675-like ankyrin-like domain-containing protein n=1 Tax=Microthlaspi erraticum TaxID=1685480 RepID=A0A6D2IS10_9BRAS|nr:unnamed protein product [Microthlaspi erraticum]
MISDEHNRETRRYQDEPRRKYHARVAKILADFKNGVGPGDAKLTLVGRDGHRATMDVHKKPHIVECDDVETYVETVVLMYCDDLKNKLIGENVFKVLALLKMMKAVIFGLIREEGADHDDVSKEMLYSLCHRCVSSHLSSAYQKSHPNMNDPGDLVGEISREAGNLLWIVDILIEKKICEEFVQLWGEQKELANLHSKIPAKYRHEISKITARICVGIGKGKILVKREARFTVLKTWLEAMYDDFGWMRRSSMDWKVVEDGLSQMILTLSLSQQQVVLM